MLDKFAEELKEARQQSELSLQQVAGKTRIDFKFLENMENGNFTFLPELYIKAFIKEYAKIVGLDEEVAIDKYTAAKHGRPYEKKEHVENKAGETVAEKKETKEVQEKQPVPAKTFMADSISAEEGSNRAPKFKLNKQSKLILSILGGVIVIFLIIYFGFIKSSSQIIINEKSYEQIRNENKQRYEKEKPSETKMNGDAVTTDSLSLTLQASDTSWVKIIMDGQKVEEFILFPKSVKKLKAQSKFEMTLGNSGAMNFSLDNKPLNFKGKHKQVEYILIDSTGLKYLKSPPNFNQQ